LEDQLQSVTYSINDLSVHVNHEYSGDLDFIILFVGVKSLYTINLDDVSLFANSPFTFFSDVDLVIVSDVLYQFD